MHVSNVLHSARWKYKTQKKSPSGHHRTILLGYIFATKSRIDNRKKPVKQQYLLHMSSQYSELQSTSGWDRFVSLGHPRNFNGFRVLAALLHGTLVVGVSQTLRRWREGATYMRQGGHYVGHWPTVTNLLPSRKSAKESQKGVSIWRSYQREKNGIVSPWPWFLRHPVGNI